MRVFICLLLFLLSLQGLNSAPLVSNTTYEIKEAHIFGRTYRYAVLEASFQEDIYYMDQWACPCFDEGSCLVTSSVEPPFDDSDIDFETLEEGVWSYQNISTRSKFPIFKIPFLPTGSIDCPMLHIEYELGMGSLSMIVSFNEIPTESVNDWYKAYFGYRSVGICPGHPKFHYGAYYVTFANQDDMPLGDFRLRWRRIGTPTCEAPIPIPGPIDVPDPVYTWVEDGVVENSFLASKDLDYFKLYAPLNPQGCTNFSVSINRLDSYGDLDVYISTDKPDDMTWEATRDGDDAMNIVYCLSSTSSDDYVIFYIDIENIGNDVSYFMVATTKQWFPLEKKVGDILFSQYTYENSFGNFPEIECGEEVFKCTFPTYIECSQDVFGCCSVFSPIAPTLNTNPLLPWNQDDDYFGTSMHTMWNGSMEILDRRLAWGLFLGYDSPNNTQVNVISSPSQCRISKWSGGIVNAAYEPLQGTLSFTKKERSCQTETLQQNIEKIQDKIKAMTGESNYYTLTRYQLELSAMLFSENITGCQEFVEDNMVNNDAYVYEKFGKGCIYMKGTEAYNQDPCCNSALRQTQCCIPRFYSIERSYPTDINTAAIESQCSTPECIQNTVQNYVQALKQIHDPIEGCERGFDSTSSFTLRTELSSFLSSCWESYPLDDDALLDCFVEHMDPRISRLLFNQWNISEAVTRDRLEDEISARFTNDAICTGPDAIRFREHYWYKPVIGTCVDACVHEPRCFDLNCPVPDRCDGALRGICYRFWGYSEEDLDRCALENQCNWDPSLTDSSDCLSGNTHICLDCNGKTSCDAYPTLDESECTSICNDGTLDLDACNGYFCNVLCEGSVPCTTLGACTSRGRCNDQDMLDMTTHGGVCIIPDTKETKCLEPTPYGCLQSTIATQVACEGLPEGVWYTPSETSTECLARVGCYDLIKSEFTAKNESACALCENHEWRNYFQWKTGQWTLKSELPLSWTEKTFLPIRSVESGLDVFSLTNAVQRAIGQLFSYSFATHSRCRYGSTLPMVFSVVCDCKDSTDDASSCFESTREHHWASTQGCAYLNASFTSDGIIVNTFDTTFDPMDYCQTIDVYKSPVSLFKLDPSRSVSSAIFQNTETNGYWIVKNSRQVFIGQVISDGFRLTWEPELNDRMEVCIRILDTIEKSNLGRENIFARMNGTDIRGTNYTVELRNDFVCANISEPGTYFAAIAVEDFEEQETISHSMIIQSRVGAVIYFLVVIFVVIQWIRIFLKRKNMPLYTVKLLFLSVVMLNALIRGVYLLLPSDSFEDGLAAVNFFIFEFPSFLFFTVYTGIIYLWIRVVLFAKYMGNRKKINRTEKKFTLVIVLVNAFMYMVFVMFIFLIAFSSQLESNLPCYQSTSSADLVMYRIKLAYWIFFAIVFISVSIAFSISLFFLLRPYLAANLGKRHDIILLSIVAVLCTVCMLIRSALSLYSAVTRVSIGPIAFVILEAIPSLGLSFYLKPFGIKSLVSQPGSTRSYELSSKSKEK